MSPLEPFAYSYMLNAIWVCALVGAVCGALSAFLMLRGWSLIGDALSHAVVPGVAAAAILGLPFSLGAFAAAALAAGAMLFVRERTALRQDAVIGLVFTAFFALGLFMVSLRPTSVDVQTIMLGNVLAIAPADIWQLVVIGGAALVAIALLWRDLTVVFFDETHARTIGLRVGALKLLFFGMLAAATVAAMQTVGAFLVIALVVTPGATAYLLADRFGRVLALAALIGTATGGIGAWASYFLDAAPGGVIVLAQTALFALAFLFAPRHGRFGGARSGEGPAEAAR